MAELHQTISLLVRYPNLLGNLRSQNPILLLEVGNLSGQVLTGSTRQEGQKGVQNASHFVLRCFRRGIEHFARKAKYLYRRQLIAAFSPDTVNGTSRQSLHR